MAGRGLIGKDGDVNFDKLQAKLSHAVEREDKYWRENDAKFRAVAQKVATYEEFEEIVKAAHIKPMTEDITQLKLNRSAWITTGRAKERNRRRMLQEDEVEASALQLPPVTDVNSFLRHWRHKADSKQRYEFLKELGGKTIYRLFKPELGHGLLGEFIAVLHEHYREEDWNVCCKLLKAFCRTRRFDLALDFLAPNELEQITELVGWVEAAGCSEEDRQRLHKGYPHVPQPASKSTVTDTAEGSS
ncbi:hypothetical protein PTSG_02174 [Salpingoeca rosetta]|uniref:Coiled-coil domain-containing protein 103 n=1 Tax=Salpingoeca rosetta (strain ATCC 50818 / BSB-021) TaxID=946362 RepID=F2U1F4_SALR5|nr:uncharacterized protein PTSG_02174 [Salpingoeca rosetta]EGD81456.1 hypothetical protein PTSG_02174 [Salpingoeca rosetta]|eukprot:XP_004996660.1 hypothetical protein PTSG_02174 [Salpingoeca rosetta]